MASCQQAHHTDGCHCNSWQNITYSVNPREDYRGELLQLLQNNVGCFVPDLSYFKLRQLETGEGNVIETTERLCRAHQDVVII
jgi:hypothetical protein